MSPSQMPRSSWLLALMAMGARMAKAQQEVIWSSVVISTFGDRIPLYSPKLSVLTPYGAQQMYDAGSYYRQRYIDRPDGAGPSIPNLARDEMDQGQITVYTLSDVFVQQSAQAFMNGLYPPLSYLHDTNTAAAHLASGSNVTGPISGLQYPLMQGYSATDPNYPYMNAAANCPGYFEESQRSVTSQTVFQSIKNNTQYRYDNLNKTVFSDAVSQRNVAYGNAYEVYDYLSYMRLHNETIANVTTDDDVAWTQMLANNFASRTYGEAGNQILSMPGRMLAHKVYTQFLYNAAYQGAGNQLNLFFTSWEPILSMMSLLGMRQKYPDLDHIPNPASSLVLELYSNVISYQNPSQPVNATYPTNSDDLMVRVLYRNGTTANATLGSYTMSAISSDEGQSITYTQFKKTLSTMLMDVTDWCSLCADSRSGPLFCTGTGGSISNGYGYVVGSTSSPTPTGPSATVAGVIGAAVTLAVTGIAALILMLLGGFRLRRDRPSVVTRKSGLAVHKRRQSSMGGFKGAEKMASDVDLPSGGAAAGASVLPKHNRTASWELKEGQNRESQQTAVGEPGPEISDVAGLKVVMDEDEDENLDEMKAVKARESF